MTNPNQPDPCSKEGCTRDVFGSKDKCISHCDKEDWYREIANGHLIWDYFKIAAFWDNLQNNPDGKCGEFIFPAFINANGKPTNFSSLLNFAPTIGKFDKAIFLDDADFSSFHVNVKANFAEAHFKGKAKFRDAAFNDGVSFQETRFSDYANFSGCTFSGQALFHTTTFDNGASFGACTFKNGAFFTHAIFKNKQMEFSAVHFAGDAIFQNAQFHSTTNFAAGGIAGNANFTSAIITAPMYFSDFTFRGEADFDSIACNSKVIFRNVVCEAKTSFTNTKAFKYLGFDEVIFLKALFIRRGKITALKFNGCSIYTEFLFNPDVIDNLFIHYSTFEKDSKIIFEGFKAKRFKLRRLLNSAISLKFTDIIIIKRLYLDGSTFNNIEINRLDIQQAGIQIKKSSFSGAIFNNVYWGDIRRINADKDIFRQLKYACEEQGDYIHANDFYEMEMNRFEIEELTPAERLKILALFKFWEKKWQDKVVFTMGRWISNHSNSWTKPLVWFVVVGLLFHLWAYSAIEYDLENPLAMEWRTSLSSFINAFIAYFEWPRIHEFAHFINPLARDAGADYKPVYAIWLLHKIFAGFITYHFIVALRRKTKR